MKNNRLLITFLLGVVTLFCSCDNFLDETPNKSGSAYIYHMDQLFGMMGSPDLYLTIDASYSSFRLRKISIVKWKARPVSEGLIIILCF